MDRISLPVDTRVKYGLILLGITSVPKHLWAENYLKHYDLFRSSSTVRAAISREMRWAGHIARMLATRTE